MVAINEKVTECSCGSLPPNQIGNPAITNLSFTGIFLFIDHWSLIIERSADTFGAVTDNSGPTNPTVARQGKQGYQFEQALRDGDLNKIGAKLVVNGDAQIAGDVALKEALERSAPAGESIIIQCSQGIIVEKAGNYYVKVVDPGASGIFRWYGRSSIGDQVKALARLRELGVHYYYEDGKIITQDAGKFAGGYGSTEYWRIWARGSWRLGTTLNDIRPRNIGAAGEIVDPAYEQHVKLLVNLVVRGVFPRSITYYQPQGGSE